MTVKEILTRWEDFETSEFRKQMDVCDRYYKNHNDITLPENGRYQTSLDEKNLDKKDETHLSDRRISHNFFKFIIGQQVAYGIARQFTIKKSIVEELEQDSAKNLFDDIKSKLFTFFPNLIDKFKFHKFNMLIAKTFEKERYLIFTDTCINAPKFAIGWLYISYNDKGQLQFTNMDSRQLCPVWKDDSKKELVEMIRRFKTTEYNEEGREEAEYIEHYTLSGVEIYKFSNDEATDVSVPKLIETRPYITFRNGKVAQFPFLPFIPIRYNSDETSLLQDIKPQIDAYDKLQSETVNNVVDIPDSLLGVVGIDASNQDEVDAFVKNLKIHRILSIPPEGDAKPILMPQDINQNELTLTRLRKDIFEIGGGVDTQNKDLKDTSGVALKWSYSNIEEKFNVWGKQIEVAIRMIIDLIIFDNKLQGGMDFSDVDYEIIFNTDSIINENETIQNLVLSKGLISPETIAAQHPYTTNPDSEVAGVKEFMKYESELNAKKNEGTNDHNTKEGISGKSV